MTEVIPRLFIGNWHDAKQLMSTMHVVTVAEDSPVTGAAKFGMVDGPGNPPELLIEAARHAAEAHAQGKIVLIHCHGGRSRSGVVTVAALMRITGKTMCECYDLLKDKHEITRIHPHLAQLLFEVMNWPQYTR